MGSYHQLRFIRAVEALDIVDDAGDGAMVLHHFLVVAAALVRRARFNGVADLDINLDVSSHVGVGLEKGGVLLQKILVFEVLLERPSSHIDLFTLLFDFVFKLSLLQRF